MTLYIKIAKFKFCQYQVRAISPNLMLTKITRYYTVQREHTVQVQYGTYNVVLYVI